MGFLSSSVIVTPLFLHALFFFFLERVQLHGVIVVLLNISAAEKHKVFCAVSGFRRGQKNSQDGEASAPAPAVFHTLTDQGCVFSF